nr:3-isopropylmalate dehydratase small subunit [uncultured Sphingomonas sp.]
MQPVTTVSGTAYPWGATNSDPDIIIPAHWLKTITRSGLGRGAFETVRAQPGNVFDDPRYAGAPILIAGDNFGCGSSREHAAWALADMGVKAVIAPSFSDIFSGNAFKNGIVPVVLPQEAVDRLVEVAKEQPITVDLETMTVTTPYQDRFAFHLDPFRRRCLMEGLDEVGLTLARDTAISKFEGAVEQSRPWIGSRSGYASIAVDGAGRT